MLPDPNKICACAPLTPAGVFNGVPCTPSYDAKIEAMLAAKDLASAEANAAPCNLAVKTIGAPVGAAALPQQLPLASLAVMKGREAPAAFVSHRGAVDCSLKTMMMGMGAAARSAKPQFTDNFGSVVERAAGAAIAVADNGCSVQNFGQLGPTNRLGWKLALCGNIPQNITNFGPAVEPVPVAPILSVCTPPGAITNFVSSDYNIDWPNAPPSPYETYWAYYQLTWDAVVGATSYIVTTDNSGDLAVSTGPTSATVYIVGEAPDPRTFTLTAITACGNVTAEVDKALPCFLAGSLVAMADGSVKVIEDVQVGDLVVGAFGEINEVLALHRPLLGSALMCSINGEHSTTNHHPHIGANRAFYSGNPSLVSAGTYGRTHKVIDASGAIVDLMLYGLAPERIQQLEVGVELKTLEGSRIVSVLETYSMPEDTQLYNLVIGGSHTYHVDGYAVTGWPREDDFNYDLWTSR